MYELIYTSLPQGLIAGRSGFSTAAVTEGFPSNLISPIENLSGYKNLYPPGSADDDRNPVNYSCQHYRFGSSFYIVLSRIAFSGLSYTGRSNILAHHYLFTPEELLQIPGGAVSVLSAKENFPPWSGNARMLPQRSVKSIRYRKRTGEEYSTVNWEKYAGNENWSDHIVNIFRSSGEKKLVLSFDPKKISGEEILALFALVTEKLSPREQLDFTFSTYCYSSGIANPVFLRAYPEESAILSSVKRLDPSSVIQLGKENILPENWNICNTAAENLQRENHEEESTLCPAEEKENSSFSSPHSAIKKASINISAPEEVPFPVDENESYRRNPQTSDDEKRMRGKREENFSSALPGNMIYIRIGGVLLLLLLLTALVLFVVLPSVQKEKKEEIELEKLEEKEEESPLGNEKKVPEKKKQTSRTESGWEKEERHLVKEKERMPSAVSVSVTFGEEKKKKVRKEKKSAEKQTFRQENMDKKVFGLLTEKEKYALYFAYWKSPFPGRIELPETLKRAAGLDLTLKKFYEDQTGEDLKEYISYRGSKRVLVASAELVSGGLEQTYKPAKDKSAGMFLSLQNGTLFIKEPPERKEFINTTRKRIKSIIFLGNNGERFHFEPEKIPAGLKKELEKRMGRIEVKKNASGYSFFLHVSDDLWAFRQFFELKVNGRPLGGNGISSRKEHLKDYSLKELQEPIRARNALLTAWQNTEHSLQLFRKKNGKKSVFPVLDKMEKLSVYAPQTGKSLSVAMKEKDPETEEMIQKTIEELLKTPLIKFAEEIPEDPVAAGTSSTGENTGREELIFDREKAEKNREKWIQKLKTSLTKISEYKKVKEKESLLQKDVEKAKKRFLKNNESLHLILQKNYPVLVEHMKNDLVKFQKIDEGKLFSLPGSELKKMISVTLSRRHK